MSDADDATEMTTIDAACFGDDIRRSKPARYRHIGSGRRDAGVGVCKSAPLDLSDAAILVRDAVDVTELMVVMPRRVMAGVIGASVTPCTVMRSSRSRGD